MATRWRYGRRSRVADGPFPWSGHSRRTMTGAPAEFLRALKGGFGAAVVTGAAHAEVEAGGARLRFDLEPLPPARHGALQLERFAVEVSVLSGSPEAASALLARVDRATQRGGG